MGVFNRITFPAFIVIPALQLVPHFVNKYVPSIYTPIHIYIYTNSRQTTLVNFSRILRPVILLLRNRH